MGIQSCSTRKSRVVIPRIPELQYPGCRVAIPRIESCNTQDPELQYPGSRVALPRIQSCNSQDPELQYPVHSCSSLDSELRYSHQVLSADVVDRCCDNIVDVFQRNLKPFAAMFVLYAVWRKQNMHTTFIIVSPFVHSDNFQ